MINYFKCLFKGHNWEHQMDANMWEDNSALRPAYIKRVYLCTKCLKVKKLKL